MKDKQFFIKKNGNILKIWIKTKVCKTNPTFAVWSTQMPHYKLFFAPSIRTSITFVNFHLLSRALRDYTPLCPSISLSGFFGVYGRFPRYRFSLNALSTIFFTAPARPHATLGAVYQALFVACYTTLRPTLLVVNHKFGVCRYKSLWSWILCLYSQVLSLFSWILSLWLWISSLWSPGPSVKPEVRSGREKRAGSP